MAKKTSFCVKLLVALCLCLGMAGGLLAQPGLSVTISGTLAPYISGSGEITSAKYVSGITATGAKGSYCLIDFNGGTTTAEAEVLLSSANTPSVGNIIAGDFKSFGSGYSYTSPPTTATVIAGGTATCNVGGTAVVSAKIDDPVGLEGATFDATTTSVSYTHLDVYKRQPPARPDRRSWPRPRPYPRHCTWRCRRR